MVRILLARHGETKWNLEGRYQGQVDTELSDRGIAQGERLAAGLRDIALDAVLASPLGRARRTAELCAAYHDLPVRTDARLLEIAHGTWEGRLSEDIAATDGELLRAWREQPASVVMPEGESLQDILVRSREAFAEYVRTYEGQTILVVAHDAVNKVVITDLLGMDLNRFWQIKQDNACVNVLEYDGAWRVVNLNATAHLGYLFSGIEQKGL